MMYTSFLVYVLVAALSLFFMATVYRETTARAPWNVVMLCIWWPVLWFLLFSCLVFQVRVIWRHYKRMRGK